MRQYYPVVVSGTGGQVFFPGDIVAIVPSGSHSDGIQNHDKPVQQAPWDWRFLFVIRDLPIKVQRPVLTVVCVLCQRRFAAFVDPIQSDVDVCDKYHVSELDVPPPTCYGSKSQASYNKIDGSRFAAWCGDDGSDRHLPVPVTVHGKGNSLIPHVTYDCVKVSQYRPGVRDTFVITPNPEKDKGKAVRVDKTLVSFISSFFGRVNYIPTHGVFCVPGIKNHTCRKTATKLPMVLWNTRIKHRRVFDCISGDIPCYFCGNVAKPASRLCRPFTIKNTIPSSVDFGVVGNGDASDDEVDEFIRLLDSSVCSGREIQRWYDHIRRSAQFRISRLCSSCTLHPIHKKTAIVALVVQCTTLSPTQLPVNATFEISFQQRVGTMLFLYTVMKQTRKWSLLEKYRSEEDIFSPETTISTGDYIVLIPDIISRVSTTRDLYINHIKKTGFGRPIHIMYYIDQTDLHIPYTMGASVVITPCHTEEVLECRDRARETMILQMEEDRCIEDALVCMDETSDDIVDIFCACLAKWDISGTRVCLRCNYVGTSPHVCVE